MFVEREPEYTNEPRRGGTCNPPLRGSIHFWIGSTNIPALRALDPSRPLTRQIVFTAAERFRE